MRLLIKWLLSAAALLLVAYVYSGVQVTSFTSALIAAFVIGLLNMFVRPVLVVLTLPVTDRHAGPVPVRHQRPDVLGRVRRCWRASTCDGFVAALIGSLIYSLLGLVIESALERLFAKK